MTENGKGTTRSEGHAGNSARSGGLGASAIEVDDLRKSFDAIEAVRGVSFEVAAGEVFGFLGPNGAGKTTTINMLCTLARPTGSPSASATSRPSAA